MFKKKDNRIKTGLLAAVGSVAAFFGVRSLLNWMRTRDYRPDDVPFRRRMESMVMDSQANPIGQSEFGSARTYQGTSHQPQTQPDRQPIPATGMTAADVADMTDETMQREQTDYSGLVDPFVQYLMGFHSMINMVRSRRQGNPDMPHNLTQEDRSASQELLDKLGDSLSGFQPGDFEDRSLEGRMYRLVTKVRDAMQNMDYTDDDLFRINGEVRSEVCRLFEEIRPDDTQVELGLVRQMYEC